MKKLVALAVAGAFVAPVYAAEVAISGGMETSFIFAETNNAATDTTAVDGNVNITATETLANGIRVRAVIDLTSEAGRDGAGSHGLLLDGAFGSIVMGEGNGAVDNLDAADFTNVLGNGVDGRNDAALVYTLPTFVDGLRVAGHYTPENGTSGEAQSVTADLTGYSIRYSFGMGTVGYASETVGTAENDGLFVTVSAGPVTFAFDSIDSEAANGVVTEGRQMSVMFEASDALSIGFGTSTGQIGTATEYLDQSFAGAYYDLGGLQLFVEYQTNDGSARGTGTEPAGETTAVGLAFSF